MPPYSFRYMIVPTLVAVTLGSTEDDAHAARSMIDVVAEVKQQLGIEEPAMLRAVSQANKMLDISSEGALPVQVNALAERLGIDGCTDRSAAASTTAAASSERYLLVELVITNKA